MVTETDYKWMHEALSYAEKAVKVDEVPIGAVLVRDNKLLAASHNMPISMNDPTGHAEIIALRQAAAKIGNYRLVETTLYVTLEPCMMCAGALVHARVGRLVYGAKDERAGAIVSRLALLGEAFLNHKVNVVGEVLADECAHILKKFFASRRG